MHSTQNPQCYRWSTDGPAALCSRASKRTGRHRGHLIRGSIEAEVLLVLFVDGEYRCLRLLARDFRRLYFEDPDDAPSYSILVRFFHLHGYVRLVMERRHMLRDEEERLAFMIDVAHREVDSLIFLDATLTTPNEFLEYYGWGLKGKKCIKTQFVINGRHFFGFRPILSIWISCLEDFRRR